MLAETEELKVRLNKRTDEVTEIIIKKQKTRSGLLKIRAEQVVEDKSLVERRATGRVPSALFGRPSNPPAFQSPYD
jgi:hypothetical protein